MSLRECADCRSFRSGLQLCCRLPPIWTGTVWSWPRVSPDDGCGEHKKALASEAPSDWATRLKRLREAVARAELQTETPVDMARRNGLQYALAIMEDRV